ncbi:hypothetical protein EVAR_68852_1 [Eumeta japonica]|uniref:Uncharacterized protein n=1 Tax=Eumeta variegata TaxID=151549 RepID=A0A4C1TK36_EUMVA|nr:hypothetical protein EVAR_68852_1 [Eumeta japonica]
MAYRIFRREKAYGCALGLLFEPHPRVLISVPWVGSPRDLITIEAALFNRSIDQAGLRHNVCTLHKGWLER